MGMVLTSCLNIDSIAFPYEKVDEYLLNDYPGEVDMELPDAYKVADDSVHIFSLMSYCVEEGDAEIYGMYIGDTNTLSEDTVIVYCHGQSANMDAYYPRAQLLANLVEKYHYGVLMMDYRGYGMSQGSPSEQGLISDVTACLNWLESKGGDPERTVIYGFSLGTAPATFISANHSEYDASKLILEAPMASTQNLTEESTLINLQASFISTLKFENAEEIKSVQAPFLWMHGTKDDYIPISNGELIYENYGGVYKSAERVEGANHGKDGVPQTMGYENYLRRVEEFIRQ